MVLTSSAFSTVPAFKAFAATTIGVPVALLAFMANIM